MNRAKVVRVDANQRRLDHSPSFNRISQLFESCQDSSSIFFKKMTCWTLDTQMILFHHHSTLLPARLERKPEDNGGSEPTDGLRTTNSNTFRHPSSNYVITV